MTLELQQESNKLYLAYLPTGEMLGDPSTNINTVRCRVTRYFRKHPEDSDLYVAIFSIQENGKPEYERSVRRAGYRFQRQIRAIAKGAGA